MKETGTGSTQMGEGVWQLDGKSTEGVEVLLEMARAGEVVLPAVAARGLKEQNNCWIQRNLQLHLQKRRSWRRNTATA